MAASPVAGSGSDRVEDDAVAMGAEADERRAGPDRSQGDAAPHDRAAPLNRRLARMHLGAHGRMQAVGSDQQRPFDLEPLAVASLDQCLTPMASVSLR